MLLLGFLFRRAIARLTVSTGSPQLPFRFEPNARIIKISAPTGPDLPYLESILYRDESGMQDRYCLYALKFYAVINFKTSEDFTNDLLSQ